MWMRWLETGYRGVEDVSGRVSGVRGSSTNDLSAERRAIGTTV